MTCNTGAGRRLGMFAAAGLTLGVLAIGGAAQAAPTGTTLAGATLTADRTAVSGVELATLTVTLHLQDAGGVDQAPGYIGSNVSATCPCAELQTVDPNDPEPPGIGAQDLRAVVLTMTSGTAQDGEWSGSTAIGAPGQGHWQLTGVIAGTLRQPDNETPSWRNVDGASYGQAVQIIGSHYPIVTISTPTALVPWPKQYQLSGRATYTDTKAPIAGLTLTVLTRFNGQWPLPTAETAQVTTDNDGYWSLSTNAADGASLVVFGADRVSQSDPNAGVQYTSQAQTGRLCCRWDVSITTTRSGTTRYINVRFSRGASARLRLQRRTSNGWTSVVERTGPTTGTFRFSTHTAGLYRVRVMDPIYSSYPLLVTHTSNAIRV